ncbi:hypothetical protein BZA77DRAFT_94890 [Pyronema omphalodes]|nr:hypothetical protein BZA77DRAFT_94890 [Pyronema omphalodes]
MKARQRPSIFLGLNEGAPGGESSDSSSGPEQTLDEDADMMTNADDSNTSIGDLVGFKRMTVSPSSGVRSRPLSPIYTLPPELLIAIFRKLSSPVDWRNAMLVSRQWASLAVELLWQRPYFCEFKNYQSMVQAIESQNAFFDYPQLIRRLNLTFIADKINNGSLVPLQKCTRLERVTLTNCTNLTDSPLKDILAANPRIQALDLSQLEGITDETLLTVAENCPRLQGLNLMGCKGITDASLIPLSKNRRILRRLKLSECNQITDETVLALATHCPQLLEIDFHKCHQISDSSITFLLSKLKHLRELKLAFCDLLTDATFLHLPATKTFDALRILDLTDCNQITDDAVHKIIKMAPRLRSLILAKCRQITDRAVISITGLGKNLHSLHLGHCSNITDAAVQELVALCTRIRYIDLACCLRLTNQSVQVLAQLPKLRRVGLVKCNNITDYAIKQLVRRSDGACPLERVHLSYCMHLTVEGITELVNSCQRLTHLSLTGIPTFHQNPEFTRFCRSPPKEFTDGQRAVFCVFSGSGVKQFRHYLNQQVQMVRLPPRVDDDDQVMEDGIGGVNGHAQGGQGQGQGQQAQGQGQQDEADGEDQDTEGADEF